MAAIVGVVLVFLLARPDTHAPPNLAGVSRDPGLAVAPESGKQAAQRQGRCIARLVDRNTGEPFGSCGVVYRALDQQAEVTDSTSAAGTIALPAGRISLRPSREPVFAPAEFVVRSGSQDLEVDGRFRIVARGVGAFEARLRRLIDDGALGTEEMELEVEGLRLGPTLQTWDEGFDDWIATSDQPLVLEVSGGTIRPAHAIWEGETVSSDATQRTVSLPSTARPAVVSRSMTGVAGSRFDFDISAPALGSLAYLLEGSAPSTSLVELFRIRELESGDQLVARVDKAQLEPGVTSCMFEGLVPGGYVVRSAVRRSVAMQLSWQLAEVREGQESVVTELDGRGPTTIWIRANGRWDAMAVHLSAGSVGSIAMSYPAFDLADIERIEGLSTLPASIRTYDRNSKQDERHKVLATHPFLEPR